MGNLFPGYFALVMATGVVSIAAHLVGMVRAARALLWINVPAYGLLGALTLARLVGYFPRFARDFRDHVRGAGFFTLVAGTCVLGAQLAVVAQARAAAAALWWVGLFSWASVTYGFFASVTVGEHKPPLERGINGAWLISVVATQSLSVLAVLLSEPGGAAPLSGADEGAPLLLFVALALFLAGAFLYVVLATLIFYRFTFFPLTMAALTPPYWINMGAVAITTLAGAMLVGAAPSWPLLARMLPFLDGLTIAFWSVATWWIPLLLLLGAWRHGVKRYPFSYDPQYWGMVFPLGMYTLCTLRLADAANLPFLARLSGALLYVALAAWLATFTAMLLHWTGGHARWSRSGGREPAA